MMSKLLLHVLFVANVALVGCAGAGNAPVEPDHEATAVAQVEAAANRTTGSEAATEIAAPESTKVHAPISADEVSRLKREGVGGKSEADAIVSCPLCHYLEPDLTVVEDDRPQTICNPYCYPAYAKGFVVKNIGTWSAPTFHVAVLMGSDSYGFDVPGLGAGQSIYFQIRQPSIYGPACGETALVLVNPFNAIVESNYNNNAVSIQGYCNL